MDGGSTVTQLLGQVEIRAGDVFQYRFDLARGVYVVTHNGDDTAIADESKDVIAGTVGSFQSAVRKARRQAGWELHVIPAMIPAVVTAKDIWG